MRYLTERYYPIVLSLLLSILFYEFQDRLEGLEEILKRFLDASLAICGALLGFLLTILTIINTIETRRMRFVRDAGKLPLLNHYLKVALFLNIITITVYFILPIIMSIKFVCANKIWAHSILIFLISYTWIANIRFSAIFIKLLTDPQQNNN